MNFADGVIGGFQARSGDKTFLDRLDDFRGRLIASILVLIGTVIAGFCVAAWPFTIDIPRAVLRLGSLGTFAIGGWQIDVDVLGFFVDPVRPYLAGGTLKYLSPTDPFVVTLKIAVCVGFVLALPYLLYQLWGLISPLMLPAERKLAGPALFGSVVLFAVGFLFCYYTVIPVMLRFTLGFQTESLEPQIVVGEYMKVVLRMLLAFGLCFELPIVVLVGTVLGIVTPKMLVDHRRHAIAVMTVASAILTPPDLSSLVLLLIPVWGLYEISIVLSRLIVRRRREDLAASA